MKPIFNKKGLSYIEAAIWVLVLSMIFSIILGYGSMMIQIRAAEKNTQRVLDSYVTLNSKEIYQSLKNGQTKTDFLDQKVFIDTLSDELCLFFDGRELHFLTPEGEELYRTTDPQVDFAGEDDTLKLQATYNIIFPIVFDGEELFELQIPQQVVAYYNFKPQ